MNYSMCPHCGSLFSSADCVNSLIPVHVFIVTVAAQMSKAALESGAVEEKVICPGSEQGPRNPGSDRRRLWKDGGEP